jgi:hypothetical protein
MYNTTPYSVLEHLELFMHSSVSIIWKPFGKRPAGRPKNRWIDGILKDIQVLTVKNWKELIGIEGSGITL